MVNSSSRQRANHASYGSTRVIVASTPGHVQAAVGETGCDEVVTVRDCESKI